MEPVAVYGRLKIHYDLVSAYFCSLDYDEKKETVLAIWPH